MTAADGLVCQLQQLVLRELRSESAVEILASARAVSERLVEQLQPLIGKAGAQALHDRSLALTRRKYRWFDAALGLPASGDAQVPVEPERMLEAAVAWLRAYVGLLETFIGEGLTLRILHGLWPDLFLLGSKKESP